MEFVPITDRDLKAELAAFAPNGHFLPYSHPNFRISDGVKHFAVAGHAFWLLDWLLHQVSRVYEAGEEFAILLLTYEEGVCRARLVDDLPMCSVRGHVYADQVFEGRSLPLSEVRLCIARDKEVFTISLPSE